MIYDEDKVYKEYELHHICAELQRYNEILESQKNNAYSERSKVVAALARLINANVWFKACVGVAQHDPNDTTWESDWRTILVIELPTGQITWHFPDSEKSLLEGLPVIDNYQWDGHTTEEKYKRLLNFLTI
jgi:hypothetical protein